MKIVDSFGQIGQPLIYVLHGWGLHSGVLKPLIDQLSAHYHVQCIDLPGHGYNQQQDLPETIESCAVLAQDMQPGIWLGWSLGGLLALNIALNHPQAVNALIMLCATPRFTQSKDWPHGVQTQTLEEFGLRININLKQTIVDFLSMEVLGTGDEKNKLKQLTGQTFTRPLPQKQALLAGLSLLEHSDLTDSLKNLRMPTLWISGRRDRMVRPSAMSASAQLCNGQYAQIKGAGHAPFINHSEEITQLIRDFLCP